MCSRTPSLAVVLLLCVATLGGACSSTESASSAGDADTSFPPASAGGGDYRTVAGPAEAVLADAVVVGRLEGMSEIVFRDIGGAATPRPFLVVDVLVDRVIAWNSTESADPARLTMLVAFSPIIDLGPMAEPFPEGIEVLLILASGTADGFLVEGEGFAVLPPGQLFYPIPTGAWFRLENGDFAGLQPKHELEFAWGPIRDFDHLVALVEDVADLRAAVGPMCGQTGAGKSKQDMGLSFLDDGHAICIWWEPLNSGELRYEVELVFSDASITKRYLLGPDETFLVVVLDTIPVPDGMDRARALNDISVTVRSATADEEVLVGGVALRRQ